MNISPSHFKLGLFAALTSLALACGDDGSGDDGNAAPTGQTGDGSDDGTSATDGGDAPATDTGSGTSGETTVSNDDAEPTGSDDTSADDTSTDDGPVILDCPDDTQTCESLTPLLHCDISAVAGMCFEYLHECIPPDEAMAGCAEFGGTFGEGACPAADALGTCVGLDGVVQTAFMFYPVPGIDAATAEQDCVDGGGEWCPG